MKEWYILIHDMNIFHLAWYLKYVGNGGEILFEMFRDRDHSVENSSIHEIFKLYAEDLVVIGALSKRKNLSSVQFSRSVASNSLWPHELQHARLPCPSPTPGACSNSCPSSWWCHPSISSSVTAFSSCPQSFPASGSFPVSWLFVSGGQSIGVSASASFFPMNIQGWFPLGLTGLISLQSKGLSRTSAAPCFKNIDFSALALRLVFYGPPLTSVHDYGKNHSFHCVDLWWQSDVYALQ